MTHHPPPPSPPDDYKAEYYYWESVVMLRKLLIIIVLVFLEVYGASLQLLVGLGVVLVAMILQVGPVLSLWP